MKFAFILLIAALPASAQVASATLSGTVTGPALDVIKGATVTVVQQETGFSRTAVTGPTGRYTFQLLPSGEYTITARSPGLQTYERRGAMLEVNHHATHDISLVLYGDTITVTAAISPVNTEDASLGYRMDNAKIASLPLATRTVISLVTLGPGAIPRQLGGFAHDVNNDVQEGSRGSVALNPPVNGNRPASNTFLLDGAYDTDRNTFAIAVYPPMDSVR
jgi:hypothetical protein